MEAVAIPTRLVETTRGVLSDKQGRSPGVLPGVASGRCRDPDKAQQGEEPPRKWEDDP